MHYYRIRNKITGATSYGSCVADKTAEQILQMSKQDADNTVVETLTYNEYHEEVDKIFVDN